MAESNTAKKTEIKWFVWTDVPVSHEKPEICNSLNEVFDFLKKFEQEFGFQNPQVIMLKRFAFDEWQKDVGLKQK